MPTQQPSGQTVAYYIDDPGSVKNYVVPPPATPIQTMTQVQDFTTTFCSTAVQGDCSSVNWDNKLVISNGAVDTANSLAAYGSASTNF